MAEQVLIYRHEWSGRYYYDTRVITSGWHHGMLAFRAYTTPEPGTVPIYRHDPQKYRTHKYDRQLHNNEGWSEGVVAFYAYATQQNGTVPIYQHYAMGGEKPRYFYDTQLKNEYGWSDGEVAFYAYPPEPTLIDDIVAVLGNTGADFFGITYYDTRDNRFTLLDTPQLWDGNPTVTQPIAACDRLLNEIALTIRSAEKIVDITTLWDMTSGFPSGGFQAAISAGLKGLTQDKKTPLVRIMIGISTPVTPMDWELMRWLQATIELNNNQKLADVRFPILIGCHRRSPGSWNHAKVVAADNKRAIVGGHNLWADGYLGSHPVHDVSGLIEGTAVGCVQNFCTNLWTKPAKLPPAQQLKDGKFSKFNESPGIPPAGESTTKGTRILSLGRLGFGIFNEFTLATNASVSARVMAFCRAKNTIRISQQSLYFTVTNLDPGFDFYTLWALVKAIQAGVNVQIVVSNQVPLIDGGYEGHLNVVVRALASLYVGDRLGIFRDKNPARDNLTQWAEASVEPPIKTLPLIVFKHPSSIAQCQPYLDELNSRLSVAPLHYSPNINYWQVGSERKLAANHAKVYIIDDSHFYVGSDNLYLSGTPHGLQEFGHLIEGKTETADFIKNYWDKIWKNSAPHTVKAGFGDLSFFVHMSRPPRR